MLCCFVDPLGLKNFRTKTCICTQILCSEKLGKPQVWIISEQMVLFTLY
jgi:hypothetical protein